MCRRTRTSVGLPFSRHKIPNIDTGSKNSLEVNEGRVLKYRSRCIVL